MFTPEKISLRTRITIAYVMIFGATLVLFSAALHHLLANHLQKEFDLALYNRAVDIAEGININLFGDIFLETDRTNQGAKIFPFSLGRSYLQLTTTRGDVFARSSNLENPRDPQRPMILKSAPGDFLVAMRSGVILRTLKAKDLGITERVSDGAYYRLLTYWVTSRGFGPFFLQYAAPLKPLDKELAGVRSILWFSVPLTLLIAVMISLLTLKRALSPLTQLVGMLKSLDRRNLNQRLEVAQTSDEIEALATSINDFLARLDRAFASQDAFVANASHELKTPLAILRGELDVLRSRARTPEEIEAFFKSASQELDGLTRLVGELLVLARIDAGEDSLTIAPLDLAELVLEEADRLQPLAKSKAVHMKLDLSPDIDFQGDGELLRVVVRNLLENAIKYSPSAGGAQVEVKLFAASGSGEISFSVQNEGPGVSPADQKRILERFVRGRNESASESGFGLGLSLAHRIVVLHGGHLEVVSSQNPIFTAKFPAKR